MLPGIGGLDLTAFWVRFRAAAPPLLRFGLRASVWTLTFLAPLLIGRIRLFSWLPPADRDEALRRAAVHRSYYVRQLTLTIKLIACLAYFRDSAPRARFS